MKSASLLAALAVPLLLTAACTQFPALDRTLTPTLAAQPFPDLIPIGKGLSAAQTSGTDPARTDAALDTRITALKARAARLRGSVLSGAERQRLARGLQ